MIKQRVLAGIDGIKAKVAKDGKFVSKKSGIVRSRLGRPGANPEQLEQARQLLAAGKGILFTAKLTRLGTSTVHNLKRAMAG
jgi:DNA invertase Pin-like site-specific DNA recombinase